MSDVCVDCCRACRWNVESSESRVCRLQISKKYTQWGAVALFFFFGARSLYDALTGEVLNACDVLCKRHDHTVDPVSGMVGADHVDNNNACRRESRSLMRWSVS